MSIVLVNDFAVGDVNLTAMMETLNITYKGKSEVTLSNYDNDTAPDVKAGSVFDCNGAIFSVTNSDETPSGYSGIANDTMFYLIYSAGLNEFIYTATAPTWSDSKQGWYEGNNRYFFSMYKDSGGTLYQKKAMILKISNSLIDGDIKTNSALIPASGIGVSEYITLSGQASSLAYDKFSKHIPNVGDTRLCTGSISNETGSTAVCSTVAYMKRTTLTRLNIVGFGLQFQGGSYLGHMPYTEYALIEGGSNLIHCQIAI